ncbi:hypothetical protein CEE34_10935 [Candidatus Aerophobetes bacterium Ae_b3a]|nr:MAG: hypothetical protein CEE34_10935 [Candidatus Aerophobetes bacterium Ae_b3a]
MRYYLVTYSGLFIHLLIDEQTQMAGCKVDLHLGNKFCEVKHSALEIYDPLSSAPKSTFDKVSA